VGCRILSNCAVIVVERGHYKAKLSLKAPLMATALAILE
jgi:hypothetical protein